MSIDPPHTPTRVTGTAASPDGEVAFDYVGCSVCRIDHPIVGPNIPQPWDRAHPGPLPSTATQAVPDGSRIHR